MAEAASEPNQQAVGKRRFYRTAFAVYLVLLTLIVICCASNADFREALSWNATNPNWVIQILTQITAVSLRDIVIFGCLSFLCGASCCPVGRKTRWVDALWVIPISLMISLAISLSAKSAMTGLPLRAPSIVVALFIAMVCLLGVWSGFTWSRSRTTVGWFFCQLVSITVCIMSGVFALCWYGLQEQPLQIDAVAIETEDRVRLVNDIREHDPRDLAADQTTRLTLSERDINQLLTWGFSLIPGTQKAVTHIQSDRISLSMTGKLPKVPFFHNHINLQLSGAPVTKQGELGILPLEFQLGTIQIPKTLLKRSGPIIVDKDWANDTTRPFFSALKQVDVGEQTVSVEYGRLEMADGFVRDTLVGIGAMEDIQPAVRAHVSALIDLAQESSELTFGDCMETAFATAQQRSLQTDLVLENRAATVALGYVLGHRAVKQLVGPDIPDIPPEVLSRFRSIKLRDRFDWTRHYTLSAALEALSNQLTSHAIGLLKEELDADGGSGFSFGDLLADRAGTAFAVAATQSQKSAEQLQERLASGFVVDDFMPTGEGLVEGLPHEEFVRIYGGTEDARFKAVVKDIDNRINQCAALRP